MKTHERPYKIPRLQIADEVAGGRRQTQEFRNGNQQSSSLVTLEALGTSTSSHGARSKKGDPPQMMHNSNSLTAELQRLRNRPSTAGAPPVLSLFVVDVSGDAAEYEQRLRSVLSPAVRLGGTADFEQESLPVDGVPDWFASVSSGNEEWAPQFARTGHDGYVEHTGGGRPWELQNWLHRFAPDEDSRGWEWWDATPAGPSRVHIWVDSWGESFFGCQDLLWAAYAAGAVHVDGPTLQKSAVWSAGRRAMR